MKSYALFWSFFPQLDVLLTGRIASFLPGVNPEGAFLGWIPGVIHACLGVT